MKSREEVEEGGERAVVCSCEKGCWQGKMSPRLLPAATSTAALELQRESQEMLLTVRMQTGRAPVQPYGARGAQENADDSHPWAPTASWLE